jgi:hypothetical protein
VFAPVSRPGRPITAGGKGLIVPKPTCVTCRTCGAQFGALTATGSQTMFWAPASWTPERLAGWVGAHHEALESMFGAATLRR